MARIDGLFKMMKEQGASDLHLSSGSQPIFRLHGEMVRLNFKTLVHEEIQGLLYEIILKNKKGSLRQRRTWTLPTPFPTWPDSAATF